MTLEKACKLLIIKHPFWGLFLMGLNKVITKNVNTLAVSKNGINVQLSINPEFWDTLNDDEQLAVLLHELHHISFNHFLLRKSFEDKELLNIAADLEVNCYINNLPKGALLVKDYNFNEKEGTKYYYDNLKNSFNENYGNTLDDHSTWKDFENLNDAEKKIVKNQVNGLLKNTAETIIKNRGVIPGELEDIIKPLFEDYKQVYDWKQYLRRILGTEFDSKIKASRKRLSLRFPDSPGTKFKRKTNILVAVDTSGSVSDNELKEFFAEINYIHKAGANIDVIEFDTEITSKWNYQPGKEIKISGRGGTDFIPAVDYYNQHRHSYTKLVIFTDGYAPVDELCINSNNLLWIITSDGDKKEYPGKVVWIPENNNIKN